MTKIYILSGKIHQKTGYRLSSIFLIINILFWCALALLLSVGVSYTLFHSLDGCRVNIFCIVGYTGLLIGLLGGCWYLDRRQ